MHTSQYLVTATRGGRSLVAGLFVLAGLALGMGPALSATDGVTLEATYMISISGFNVGRADVKARFTDRGYAAAISGSTYGVSRFVSDASATMAGSGRISGTSVLPASYNLETREAGFETSVSMTMRSGAIVGLQAIPLLPTASDRVPITAESRQNVVDPIGAFMVAMDKPGAVDGNRACNRVVHIFDGWKRFDIRLSYRETRPGSSNDPNAPQQLIVCAARYVPVAGHRKSDESVAFMANNQRLEVWLAPVPGTRYLIPARLSIGTDAGELVINARNFNAGPTSQVESGQ